jgi:hypothetical protein
MPADFPAAFEQLREILRRHADGMTVLKDEPNDFTVITRAIGPNKKPIWFGAVMMKKSAVTYHLFPLYFNPALQATVSPELAKRKQGKTCFWRGFPLRAALMTLSIWAGVSLSVR